jgi:hypothetical protein
MDSRDHAASSLSVRSTNRPVDELRARSNESDELGCVDPPPPPFGNLDQLEAHGKARVGVQTTSMFR